MIVKDYAKIKYSYKINSLKLVFDMFKIILLSIIATSVVYMALWFEQYESYII